MEETKENNHPSHVYVSNKHIHTLSNRFSPKRAELLTRKLSFSDVDTYFPDGFEIFFLLLYFISLPYIAGFFFYLSPFPISILKLSHPFFIHTLSFYHGVSAMKF